MTNVSLHQFLVLYTWFPLAAILFFMLLIGRFYQKFSGERTFFWYYLVPIVAFGGVAVRYAGVPQLHNDPLADALAMIGGVSLIFLAIRLLRRMLS